MQTILEKFEIRIFIRKLITGSYSYTLLKSNTSINSAISLTVFKFIIIIIRIQNKSKPKICQNLQIQKPLQIYII